MIWYAENTLFLWSVCLCHFTHVCLRSLIYYRLVRLSFCVFIYNCRFITNIIMPGSQGQWNAGQWWGGRQDQCVHPGPAAAHTGHWWVGHCYVKAYIIKSLKNHTFCFVIGRGDKSLVSWSLLCQSLLHKNPLKNTLFVLTSGEGAGAWLLIGKIKF